MNATSVLTALANAVDFVGPGIADLEPLPREVVHEAPQCTLYRYRPIHEPGSADASGPVVLLVPPLAGSARCYDLRRGQSFAEHLVGLGFRTFLVDYGAISFDERNLGLEHWFEGVLPAAVAQAGAHAGGAPVHIVGWSLGGLLALFAMAADPALAVASITLVGCPADPDAIPATARVRSLIELTGGAFTTLGYRTLGYIPEPIVKRTFMLSSLDKVIMKPVDVLLHLDDREHLASIEATDAFIAEIAAYPGRVIGQILHRILLSGDLSRGTLVLSHRTIHLSDVTTPVLSIAGSSDLLAPAATCHAVAQQVGSAEVRCETAPGGHLGVLAGRGAAATTWHHITSFIEAHAAR